MKAKQRSVKVWVLAAALMLSGFCARADVTFTSLYSFAGGNDGYNPNGLVQSTNGDFYGTTFNGGANSAGSVFKISPNGALTSLYSFTGGNDGANPAAGLAQGSDGYLYGTCQSGGNPPLGAPVGTVFKISPNGRFINLYSFSYFWGAGFGKNTGVSPQAVLVLGTDGNFYGSTFAGGVHYIGGSGSNGFGTVFNWATNGTLNSLYWFGGGNDGANPAAGLTQGNDGYFYGTTQSGGVHNFGTVFKMSTNGALTTLHSFSGGNDGGGPLGRLVRGENGNFYGTTPGGGLNAQGTVFKVNTNGMLTTLYSFTGADDGGSPQAGLVRGSEGNFYGTTESGGTNGGGGTVFKITAQGVLTSLYSFTGFNDGSNPQAGLVQGRDGSFYGTTFNGGRNGAGTVFRLTVPLGPPRLAILSAGTNVILTWTNTASGYTLESTYSLVPPVVWASISAAPVIVNGQNTVTYPIAATQQFFRLSQ